MLFLKRNHIFLLLVCFVMTCIIILGIQFKEKSRLHLFRSKYSTTTGPYSVESTCNGTAKIDFARGIPNLIVRHMPQCIAQYETALGPSPIQRIPRIRHILWKNRNVSTYFAKQLKSWQDIQPDWKYILWRDEDMDKFVAKHYAGVLQKFRSLPEHIMRVDLIRYMILHKFGGVYADLDYILVRPLNRFLKFPAVVTRVTELLALLHFGMSEWPPHVFAEPAFLMSEPRNPFFHYCIMQLMVRPHQGVGALQFAGPLGLSELLERYANKYTTNTGPEDIVVVPASNSFYPYLGHKENYTSDLICPQVDWLNKMCKRFEAKFVSANYSQFCNKTCVIEFITDITEPVYAIHDSTKSASSYNGGKQFFENPVDISTVLPNVVMADTVY